jgi:hypothetical protein
MPVGDDIVDAKIFEKLAQLADEWIRADHAVQEHVIEQLIAYRDALEPAYRERFVRYVNRKDDIASATSVYRLFYGALR